MSETEIYEWTKEQILSFELEGIKMAIEEAGMPNITRVDMIADLVHEVWSEWMRWQFSLCKEKDGALVIPANFVARWARQMSTPYGRLSEKERDSDIDIAERYLNYLNEWDGAVQLASDHPEQSEAKE